MKVVYKTARYVQARSQQNSKESFVILKYSLEKSMHFSKIPT